MPSHPPSPGKVRSPEFDWQIMVFLLLAWAWPGLGHCFAGQMRRGMILMVCVCALWLTGLLIGGISAVDRYDTTDSRTDSQTRSIMFFTQISIAPNIVIDRYLQQKKAQLGTDMPAPGVAGGFEPSLGRGREQGMLFISLAGLLNTLLILDLLFPLREPIAPVRVGHAPLQRETEQAI